MKENLECIVCGGSSMSLINSYKHHWLSCNDCGNIFRKIKKRYFIPRILHRGIANKILPSGAINMLYPMQEVIEEERRFYDYYDDASKSKVEETKWFGQVEQI